MYPWMQERLEKELAPLVPNGLILDLTCKPDRTSAVWQGASAFGKRPGFLESCISKEMYDEEGPILANSMFI